MRIGITFDYKAGGIKKATNDVRKLGAASKATTFALKKSQIAYALATTAAIKLAKASMSAMIEEEKSMKTLRNTLRTIGMESATGQAEAFIASLQDIAAVADDQLRPALAQIVSQVKDLQAAEQLLQLATEISSATGKDLGTVVTALTRAYAGQRKGLTTLGVGMDATYLKTASLADIIQALNDKFSGSNQTMLDSYSGRLQRIGVSWGTFKENLGKGLLDMFEIMFGGFENGLKSIEEFGVTVGDFFRGLGVLWNKIREWPIIKWLTGSLGPIDLGSAFSDIVKLGRDWRLESERLHKDDVRENKRMAQIKSKNEISAAVAAAKKIELEKAKIAAKAANTKKQTELEIKYNVENANIAAAFAKAQDEGTKQRLKDLLEINIAQDAENLGLSTMAQILDYVDKLLKASLATFREQVKTINDAAAAQSRWTDEVARTNAAYNLMLEKANQVALLSLQQGMSAGVGTASAAAGARYAGQGSLWFDSQVAAKAEQMLTNAVATASLAQGQAAGLSLTDSLSGARYAAQAAQSYAQSQSTPVVVNVAGTVISESDLQQAIIDAVNTGARSGTSFSQVFSRL